MTTIATLRAEIAQLSAKLDAFEKQPQFPITVAFPELRDGEKYVGVVISADGTKREHIILMPGTFTGTHAEAMKWADSIGGELPDRVESALLFAMKASGHLAGEFDDAYYWTREIHASYSDYAWSQTFFNGAQSCYYTYNQSRARAVRRLFI